MTNFFQASVVTFDITPPVGSSMEGYSAREDVSQGVHDPLQGQVLLLKAAEGEALVIALDLLGVPLSFTHEIRSAIHDLTGIPRSTILVACSHTHSGPAGILTDVPGLRTEADPALQAILRRKIAGAAAEAQRSLQPARMGVGSGNLTGVGANRNNPLEGPQDREVLVLRVDGDNGEPLAVLMNYGCHPTILGHENLLFSADFPGAARRALNGIYPQTAFLFINGASGDISTRFTRRSQDFSEVERSGRILAGEVLRVMQMIDAAAVETIAADIQPITLPFRTLPDEAIAKRMIEEREQELKALKAAGAPHGEIRKAFTRLQGAQGQAMMRPALAGRASVETEIQVLALDDTAILSMPGEPFTRIVLDIKQKSPFSHTAVASYANDEAGYFPDAASFEAGTYEALISPYQDTIAADLTKHALSLLERVHHAEL